MGLIILPMNTSSHMVHKSKKGFTLIELLVVIGVVAILSLVVILVLNPAELIRQGRDSQRLAELDTLNKALLLYNLDVSGPLGAASTTYISVPDPAATSTLGDQCQGFSLPALPSGYVYHCAATSTYRNIDGTGWIPLNFNQTSIGSPLAVLPKDPINQVSSGFYYTYSVGSWEFSGVMESQKYTAVSSKDGGKYSGVYEVGTDLMLLPIDRSTASSSASLALSNVGANVTTSTAAITWNTTIIADSKVNYGLTSGYGSSASDATQVTSHSINLSSLATSTTYHFQVQSVAGSSTVTSTDATFTTAGITADTTPPTPNPMTFASSPSAASTSSITMAATAGSDSSTPILYSFAFTACSANGGTGGASSGFQVGTAYTNTGLQVNKCYAFTVQAEDSAGTPNVGTASASSSAYTLANIPGAPILSSPTTSTLALAVNVNGNPTSSPATAFAIQVTSTSPADSNWNGFWVDGTGAPSSSVVWMTSFPATVKSLQASTTYGFTVKARNNDVTPIETAQGAIGSGTTSAAGSVPPAPGTPSYTNLVSSTPSTLTVNWASSTGANFYKIERGTDGNTFSQITTTTLLTFGDSGLSANTTYWYRVRASNGIGDGAFSASSSVLTYPGTPGTPTYASIASSTLTVNWTTPTGSASSTKIERATNGNGPFSQIATTTLLTFNDSGLATSTTYFYRVRSTNAQGDGLASASSSVTTTSGVVSHTFVKAQAGVHTLVTAATTTISCTFASNPATGDLVVVGIMWFNGTNPSSTITSVKDASNTVYTVTPHSPQADVPHTAGTPYIAYLASAPSTAKKTITVTFGTTIGGSGAADAYCDDFTVTGAGAVAFDSDAASAGSGTAINLPSVPVTGSNDLLYSMVADSGGVSAVNAPWTIGGVGVISTDGSVAAYDLSANVNTTVNMTSAGSSDTWNSVGASFK